MTRPSPSEQPASDARRPYRTRFAPSPTGAMHLGHARTHLATWLRARSLGGRIVMRIEDLDPPRERPGAAAAFLRDHEWLGLDWDEGPHYQSERGSLYEEALDRLAAADRIYPCTCSRRDVNERATQDAGDGGLAYPGTCANGPSAPGRPCALRFRQPEPAAGFVDAVAGTVAPGGVHGDFVLRRADGLYAYHLAVVVDDIAMGITEVVRGADLLSSTARHLALFEALDAPPPGFAHVPLLLEGGAKLSKRLDSVGVCAFRDAGRSPEALLGALGHSLGLLPTPAPARLDELVARFDFGLLARATGNVPALLATP